MRTDDVVAELVTRMLHGGPLLPMPQASQDLGMLAWRIDQQDAALVRVRELHVAFPTGYCQECGKDMPCPTIEELDGKS